jgi:AraC family transcriptional regulator
MGIPMTPKTRPSVSEASLRCRSEIPSRRCVSSRDLGWSSLLLDVHSGMNWDRAYTAVTTLDPRIGVHFLGNYFIHFRSRGAWRKDVYRPGTTTVLRSDDERGFRFAPFQDDVCEFANIYLPLEQLAETVDHLRRPGQRVSVPSFNQVQFQDRAITEVTRAVMRAMDAGADELYAQTVSAWLSVHILVQERSFGLGEDTRNGGDISDKRLRRVIEFMSVHYAEQITLEQLAAEAGISKYHFTRLFHQKLGKTPFRFLTEIRLTAARKMLIATDLRVNEIALACGYTAASYFTIAFTARYGVSPLKFRLSYDS